MNSASLCVTYVPDPELALRRRRRRKRPTSPRHTPPWRCQSTSSRSPNECARVGGRGERDRAALARGGGGGLDHGERRDAVFRGHRAGAPPGAGVEERLQLEAERLLAPRRQLLLARVHGLPRLPAPEEI